MLNQLDVCSYSAAAEVLAESTDPFEVSVLKFLSTTEDRRSGLKRFLDLKLNSLTSLKVIFRFAVLRLYQVNILNMIFCIAYV